MFRNLFIRKITGILISRQLCNHISVHIIDKAGLLQTEGLQRTVFHCLVGHLLIFLIDRIQL